MSTEFKTSTADTLSVNQQRRQANILLLRLQWLFILLLVIALVWLYVAQQRFQNQINERLQSNEHVVSRLNEMDDRLFSISQQSLPEPNTAVSNQAQNQLNLLRIQMQVADRLLADNNYKASIELLRGLLWQLSQDNNEISPALTIVIKQSLTKDIERLQAQSSQPSPWQLQNLAIQNIQDFLHSYDRNISRNDVNYSDSNRNDNTKTTSDTTTGSARTATNKVHNNSAPLNRQQLTIHEVIMTLNLAIQASNMREQDQLIVCLSQAREQLQTLVKNTSSTQKNNASKTAQSSATDTDQINKGQQSPTATEAPENITEVIVWLDKLIADAPKPKPLLTTQILDKPKR